VAVNHPDSSEVYTLFPTELLARMSVGNKGIVVIKSQLTELLQIVFFTSASES
jgi:hypothetical protein